MVLNVRDQKQIFNESETFFRDYFNAFEAE